MTDLNKTIEATNRIFAQHLDQGTSRKLATSFCFDYLADVNWDIAEGWKYAIDRGMGAYVMDARGCSNFIDLAAAA